ncbi:hypothetical protein DL93DRAFT_2128431 [Clavulina sp. PMI_390]|nr:hypothetical protein DL93DRAFT_2128431 [Clavulina sp. PMI_390]
MDILFLGTGSSAGLPYIDCLTAPADRQACETCLSTLTARGKANIRRNTSAVVRVHNKEAEPVTVVIDVGKTFQAAALEWFPKHSLRKIDAVLITHSHADAMNGLDDLRSWTLYGLIQPFIDIYLSLDTFEAVKRSFPYLVHKERATGSGDVPEFRWHIISEQTMFEIGNTEIFVTPFAGEYHDATDHSVTPWSKNIPFRSFGFKFSDQLIYISDASHIPDEAWQVIKSGTSPPAVCVLDCLQLQPHPSHFSFAQSVAIGRRIGATRTYLTGFCHAATHNEYVVMSEAVSGAIKSASEMAALHAKGFPLIAPDSASWVRPAHDGLKVSVKGDAVSDTSFISQPQSLFGSEDITTRTPVYFLSKLIRLLLSVLRVSSIW